MQNTQNNGPALLSPEQLAWVHTQMSAGQQLPIMDTMFASAGGLFGDLYGITMAAVMFDAGLHETPVTAGMFTRSVPFGGGFTVSAGQELWAQYSQHFRFFRSHLDYLANLRADNQPLFKNEAFLRYLEDLRLSVDVDMLPEGSLFVPGMTLSRVHGSAAQVVMLEGSKLNLTNASSTYVTLAQRFHLASGEEKKLIQAGLRRCLEAMGLLAERSSIIGGFDVTSGVVSAAEFGLVPGGTIGHFLVMLHGEDAATIRNFLKTFPHMAYHMPDTYNTLHGLKTFIAICKEQHIYPVGCRIDNGNHVDLVPLARRMFDEAGFLDTKVCASNNFDVPKILEIQAAIAQQHPGQLNSPETIEVGTNYVVPKDVVNGVYKLEEIHAPTAVQRHVSAALARADVQARMVMKVSDGDPVKASIPGAKDCYRVLDGTKVGYYLLVPRGVNPDSNSEWIPYPLKGDVQPVKIGKNQAKRPLLEPTLRAGKLVRPLRGPQWAAEHLQNEMRDQPQTVDELLNGTGTPPQLLIHPTLYKEMKRQLGNGAS